MLSNHGISQEIFERIRMVSGPVAGLHDPVLGDLEREYVDRVIREGYVSTVGQEVSEVEKRIASLADVDYAVATSSGTAALHLALLCADVRPNDEVLVPAYTFVATANAIAYLGAVPNFVDIDEFSLGVCVTRLEKYLNYGFYKDKSGSLRNKKSGRRVSCIVPVHCFGLPCDVVVIRQLAEEYRLKVVEDSAESFGSKIDGRSTGSFGLAGALSFNGNKIVTSGGGGCLLTNSEESATMAKHLSTTAKSSVGPAYFHDVTGFNYRMPNLNAALLMGQLDRFSEICKAKRATHGRYVDAFKDMDEISVRSESDSCESNYWLTSLFLSEPDTNIVSNVIAHCAKDNIAVRPGWTPLNKFPMFIKCPSDKLPVTNKVARSVLCVPSGANLARRIKV